MISPKKLLENLKRNKIDFFTGVPDSVLQPFSSLVDKLTKKNHIIAVNEGAAVSIGIGYNLLKKKIPCIYLQNSGLSNAINPLISIANEKVYSIPLFLMIGWRGSPKSKDEPQHLAKGNITLNLLKLLKIKYLILRKEDDLKKIKTLVNIAKKKNKIVACLIEKKFLLKENKQKIKKNKNELTRAEFIIDLLKNLPNKTKIVSTTGYTSRELMQLRKNEQLYSGEDFYMVGGMGHASMVSLGYALNSKIKNKIICLDGDGSVLMHFGALHTVGNSKLQNFYHIILNNNSHESVGGQVTFMNNINLKKISEGLKYKKYFLINKKKNLNKKIKNIMKAKGPILIEVKIKNNHLKDLMRPKNLIKIKEKFQNAR
jgi:phosphonopyruvate decarboxylase